jgi:hypothetical protein
MQKLSLILSAALLTAACASGPPGEPRQRGIAQFEGDPRLGEAVRSICFSGYIDSFSRTTRDTVVLRRGRDHYLVETFGSCPDLDFAQQIATRSVGSCLGPGDSLFVVDAGGPRFGSRRCSIKTIHEWHERAGSQPEAEADAGAADN